MTDTTNPTVDADGRMLSDAAANLKLYDTASHAVEPFVPVQPGHVGIYVCGATVQSSPHIGHIRAAVAFDVVRRWLLRLGYTVTFVRNVTDIDDKILDKAAAAGQQWWERAYIYEREFTEAYDALGVLPPTYEPRATGHMLDMIDLIRRILDNGHGYMVLDEAGNPTGDVYFDVPSWPRYGELTHQKQTVAGAETGDEAAAVADRMGPSVDNTGDDKYNPVDPADASPDKHDPRDFALWKRPKPTDPPTARWSTPFGVGRPGWHLECSAMSHRYLGDEFDIHGGGLDLRFPHHENEMAQSRAAGWGFARHWMHSAWVTAKGEKMSKSLGNGLSVPAVLAEHPAWVVRYALGSVQYRSMLEWSDQTCRRGDRRAADARRDRGRGHRRSARRVRGRDERRFQRFRGHCRDLHRDPRGQHVGRGRGHRPLRGSARRDHGRLGCGRRRGDVRRHEGDAASRPGCGACDAGHARSRPAGRTVGQWRRGKCGRWGGVPRARGARRPGVRTAGPPRRGAQGPRL